MFASTKHLTLFCAASLCFSTHATASSLLEEVVVTAEFRPVDELDLAASISVFDQDAIDRRGALHLEQLLNLAPNVNLSSGASRGRFVQIRGIGERSQFIEPVNPSVGLIIDGMDFTGIGGAAVTMDMRQVEILRGPQGTLFGANALAGMVNMVSNGPTDSLQGRAEMTIGNDGLRSLSGALGGPASENTGWRLAFHSTRGDGHTDNIFLGRPTNDIDERSARGRFLWQPSDMLELGFTLFLTDIDNGYDAFSLDNTRDTYSDEPGHDRLEAAALAVTAAWELADGYRLEGLYSRVQADSEYGYDEDWSHPGICDGTPCDTTLWGFDWWYASTDEYRRQNDNDTLDLRLLSSNGPGRASWAAGLYVRDQEQDLQREYTYAEGDFGSHYSTGNLALYGQLELPMGEAFRWVAGLRWERRDWDYRDTSTDASPGTSSFRPVGAADSESDWGGKLALEYRTRQGILMYGLVSRGYKAGGYNTALASEVADLGEQGITIPPDALLFDSETLWNFEVGVKGAWLDGSLNVSAALFHQERNDVQVKQSIVIPADTATGACPCSFVDSLQNAAGGSNSGLEVQLEWLASDSLVLFGTLGLLDTEYRDFLSFTHIGADPENGVAYDMSGRAQPHAPEYQFSAGGRWYFTRQAWLQADIEGKDSAFASASHDERLGSFRLLNLRLAWEAGRWTLSAWARNLGDERVETRGFGGFGNDPRKFYATEPYYQLGEPRVFGLSAMLEY
jgi:outer membrane receptor protein involved in Fe transport